MDRGHGRQLWWVDNDSDTAPARLAPRAAAAVSFDLPVISATRALSYAFEGRPGDDQTRRAAMDVPEGDLIQVHF